MNEMLYLVIMEVRQKFTYHSYFRAFVTHIFSWCLDSSTFRHNRCIEENLSHWLPLGQGDEAEPNSLTLAKQLPCIGF